MEKRIIFIIAFFVLIFIYFTLISPVIQESKIEKNNLFCKKFEENARIQSANLFALESCRFIFENEKFIYDIEIEDSERCLVCTFFLRDGEECDLNSDFHNFLKEEQMLCDGELK